MNAQDKKNVKLLADWFTCGVKFSEVKYVEICSATPNRITLQDKWHHFGGAYFNIGADELQFRTRLTVKEFREWLLKNGATKRKRVKRLYSYPIYD
jgi:hypothetical protein